MTDKSVRIFVSSPADVDHERAAVKDIVEQLASEYLPYFELRTVLWEEEALTADRTFQAGLTQPEDCDIVLVILWTRLGSPLPQEPYRGMTGTEWEFVNAVEASAKTGIPEVLVYKKTTPKLVDITDAALAREAVEDRRRLEAFFRAHFFFDDNSFRRAFRTFDNATAFRELVSTQLRKLLNRRISAERRATTGDLRWQGSPFRPDRPFESSDARIFTGREQEVRELLQRLEQLATEETSLLLVAGPSGSGKTSLLRAGVLPRLTRPFQFDEIAAVRACLVDPSAAEAGPTAAIAEALCAQPALAEPLANFGLGSAELHRLLISDPALAAQQISSALKASSPEMTTSGGTRLLLLLDPLDAALDSAPLEQLQTFATTLQALASATAIWVVAILRSDALPALERLSALHPLIQRQGWSEIGPPSAARIRQVIEIPARIAGIEIDAHELGERELVEHIEADANRLRLWPPLIQAVLDSGYQRALQRQAATSNGGLRLSSADYLAAGGINGHVLTRAAAVWAELDPETRSAMPKLCRALISLEGGASGRPTNRFGSLELLRQDPACERLLQRLIESRLVIAEGLRDPNLDSRCEPPDYRLRSELAAIWRQTRADWRQRLQRLRPGQSSPDQSSPGPDNRNQPPLQQADGDTSADDHTNADRQTNADSERQDWRQYRAVVSFSHPALLTFWEPVRHWLAVPNNRQLLARRFQLDRQAQLWKRTNCNSEYLLRDVGSAEAEALRETYADELEPLEREFITQSQAHLAFLRRRSQLVRAVGVVLAALMLLSAISAGLAYRAYADAQANLSRSKLNEANLSITRGNTPQAVDLALAAGADLPERAVQTLGVAFSSNRLIAMASAPNPIPDQPRSPAFSDQGSHLAAFLPDGSVTLLELQQGRFVPTQALADADLGLHTLVFGPDTQVFGIGSEGVWRLPASAGAEPDYACGTPPGLSFGLDDRRQRLALSQDDGKGQDGLCVLDLSQPGRIILDKLLEDGPIRSLSFSPDGESILTAASIGRSRLIDLDSGAITLSLPADGPIGRPFDRALFDATGERIAIAAADERIRLYRGNGEAITELSSARIGGREFSMHRSAVRDLAFDPSGAFLVAADDEGQIVRWTLSDDAPGAPSEAQAFDQAVVLTSHRLSAGTVRIVAPPASASSQINESLVLSASLDGTARLTGLQTGKAIAVLGHDAAIITAGFHAQGERVATFSARDETARLWRVTPVSQVAYRLQHPDHVWYVDTAIAPAAIARGTDTLLLATAGFDGGVRVWRYGRDDSSSGPEPWAVFLDQEPMRPARQVQFSPLGNRLASAHNDGTARIADLVKKRIDCKLQVTESEQGIVYNALFSPDASWVLTTSDDPVAPVRAFSSETCEPLETGNGLQHDETPIEAAALQQTSTGTSTSTSTGNSTGTGAGTLIATGDEIGVMRLSERSPSGQWRHLCDEDVGIGEIGDIALSPDGSYVAIAGADDRSAIIRLDLAALKTTDQGAKTDASCGQIQYLDGHSGRVYSIAFAPDGKQIVTASLDKTARVWSPRGEAIAILAGHQDRIYRADFSPDGQWILTGSRDGSIRIWKRPTKRPTAQSKQIQTLSTFLPLEAGAGGVANAVFSPDGHYVAGAYWENAAILWRLWAEDNQSIGSESKAWGPDRSQLALVQEAYRFRRDNKVDEPDFSLLEESE
ncbi:AAA family ATPase [Lamprobacter modestohalophilus]|uniref:nSTAND1 domain-containing NTPase n=1 Tax=Lamprobacter modestohalophilus TaxID=1064514 RepID=UPI002ADEE256|nr:AAA family ATPase [Lamprobacter modestohalophilus]MEA1048735.1 AAA family ATPase [Lamprobacter modestohalophilus]